MAVTQAIPVTRHPYADGSYTKMLIDGKWVDAASGKRFETHNPATGELLATVAEGDAEDINRAVAAARRAFEGPWSKVKPFERQALLLKLADLVEKNFEELSQLDTLDMGAPIKVVDLARSLAHLAGKSENEVEIQFTGLRAGEKLTEQLFYATEQISSTSHPKIKRTSGSSVDWLKLLRDLNELENAVSKGTVADVISKIKEIVPEFCSTLKDDQECVFEEASQPRTAAAGWD